jgi:hypothetical protein
MEKSWVNLACLACEPVFQTLIQRDSLQGSLNSSNGAGTAAAARINSFALQLAGEQRAEPGSRGKVLGVEFHFAIKAADPDLLRPGLKVEGALLVHFGLRVGR